MYTLFKKLGPGLLFAGAAIGVSHLVQSTRAGADFGLGLIWALLLVNLFKYPFFQFGPRYASATGESLLEGYKKLGHGVLITYFTITLATMFTIQTAVTIVTAGLATSLFGGIIGMKAWTVIILLVCFLILVVGKYQLLDKIIKLIIITLTISTIAAVCFAYFGNTKAISLLQVLPENAVEISFLIAFMGWMPAPLDISIWHSIWVLEKGKNTTSFSAKTALFDFNIGYLGTIFLGVCFVLLGTMVLFNTGASLSDKASVFANQLIDMYTQSLGSWTYIIIGIAAFTTMFSTTLTTLDASPRAMAETVKLLTNKPFKKGYLFWIMFLIFGCIAIFFLLASEMGLLIKIATILSFLTAPFFAVANYTLISSKHTPKEWRPTKSLHILSWLGIIFLFGFSIWYLLSL